MTQYRILVADAARARLFSREKKFSPPVEIDSLVHPESRLRRQDLVSDRPGQVFESRTPGENINEEPTDPRTAEAASFARELAHKLREDRVHGGYKHLIVVAEPRLLGMLRKALDDDTRQTVVLEISRNLTRAKVGEIAEAIDTELQ
ncbi:host attachment protein [Wenzhouxiangella sp. AB-CW3]|uniref:host attachment protein n=1 Tax=Wenzhouxiangella sp. AB-CW3 TaxID=2771012 RepID=UPI00168BA1C0|nr:host attachment protein [Wenzhouxiangella sp. AB-CW3]QOC21236.1 host attachment protein [Wenzhouxiangella sp. AB-CW3]